MVGSVSLFGLYARGEADEGSDVDILIDRGKLGGLIEYFSFVNEPENVLGCNVDVVTSGIEDKNFLAKNFHRYTSEIAFQYVCGMCLIQIGELAGHLSNKTADELPEIT